MQDYQKHGIENHPAISTEYVRFLVAHSAQGALAQFDKDFKALENKLKSVEATAKAAQSAAGTAQNIALEAKTLALKK